MIYNGYELLWLLFVYSFAGWIVETVIVAITQKKLVNKGLIDLPFCMLYGIGILIVTVFGNELQGIWLLVGSLLTVTVVRWVGGHLIERIYHQKWWDYSEHPWNLDGYVSVPDSLLLGGLTVIMVKWCNPFLLRIYRMLPRMAGQAVILVLLLLLGIDILATVLAIYGKSKYVDRYLEVDRRFDSFTGTLTASITGYVERRITKAYPKAKKLGFEKGKTSGFAVGGCFYKLVWIFVIGSFLGDVTETIFCRIKAGVWMSRSSLVWGPFSIVWGFAMVVATMLLYKYQNRSDGFLFTIGTVLGGAYEYICSVLSELVFGVVFWDYSELPFNLGGRINLLYCFFWGIAAVVWMKIVYPRLSGWIEKIPIKSGTVLTWCLVAFMTCNMAVSGLALIRNDQRAKGIEAEHGWQQVMDERFDEERLMRIYPNMLTVD